MSPLDTCHFSQWRLVFPTKTFGLQQNALPSWGWSFVFLNNRLERLKPNVFALPWHWIYFLSSDLFSSSIINYFVSAISAPRAWYSSWTSAFTPSWHPHSLQTLAFVLELILCVAFSAPLTVLTPSILIGMMFWSTLVKQNGPSASGIRLLYVWLSVLRGLLVLTCSAEQPQKAICYVRLRRLEHIFITVLLTWNLRSDQ